jgi:predicted O-methyltransferase YrrM
MNIIHKAISLLYYLWRAKTIFYLHSPFVYQFYKTVLSHPSTDESNAIFTIRKRLANDTSLLAIKDFGTGLYQQKSIRRLNNKVAIRQKYGQVLSQLVVIFQPKNIIEIGTSIGISSSYLAQGNPKAITYCLEGSEAPLLFAKKLHSELGFKHIEYRLGDFSDTLPSLLNTLGHVDFVFFDGNHTLQATLDYFEWCVAKATPNSIFVFDDIYWSKEMTTAWKTIKADNRIRLTIDIYQLGICFFREDKLAKENFVLLY